MLGVLLWHVAGEIGGDGLFHLARVRKLDAFDSLSLDAVNEFADGGLHPGYAFPLWHGFLALVAGSRSSIPPSSCCTRRRCSHRSRCSSPTRPATRSSAGSGRRSRSSAPRSGDRARARPRRRLHRARAAGDGLAAAARARGARAGARLRRAADARGARLGRRGGARARGRPPDLRDLPLAAVRGLPPRPLARRAREARRIAAALAALVVPAAFLAWLLPVVRDTASHAPGRDELQRAFRQYAGQLDVFSETSYRLAPEVFGRAGASPSPRSCSSRSPGLALRSRWAAYVLGGFLAVAAVMLVPPLFVAFSDLASISQSRRAAGFWPLAFAFAGGFVVLAALCCAGSSCRLALAGGIALQLLYPGEFDYRLEDGGPALVTWFAVAGGVVALALGLCFDAASLERPRGSPARRRRSSCSRSPSTRRANWSPSDARGRARSRRASSRRCARTCPGRRRLLRPGDELPDRIRGAGLHRRRAAEPRRGHGENRPVRAARGERPLLRDRRRRDRARAGADWLVVDRNRFDVVPQLDSVYRDDRYTLYVVP